jgi:hypothetical protein
MEHPHRFVLSDSLIQTLLGLARVNGRLELNETQPGLVA